MNLQNRLTATSVNSPNLSYIFLDPDYTERLKHQLPQDYQRTSKKIGRFGCPPIACVQVRAGFEQELKSSFFELILIDQREEATPEAIKEAINLYEGDPGLSGIPILYASSDLVDENLFQPHKQ